MSETTPIEENVRERIKDRVLDEIEDGIDNAFRRTQDPGGVISGRIPSSGATAVARSLGRASCRRWARGAGPQGPLADAAYRGPCEEYLDDIGELPGGGEYGPVFPGGQCPVAYSVTVLYTDIFLGTPRAFSATREVIGPITGLGPMSPTDPVLSILSPAGNVSTGLTNTPFACADFPEDYQECDARITALSRVDGLPDDCGNGQDGYQPTDYLPDDGGGTEPINAPGLPPFTIDIGPDGDINIEFPGFDGPGRTVDDPFAPTDPTDPPPWVPTAPPPGDQGEEGDPEPVAPGEDAEGEDAERYLVGVRVVLTTIPDRARVTFLGGNAFYQYAYTVLMGGAAGVERDNDSALAPSEAFYHAPENANRYSVAFRNGFGGTVIPYWRNPD